MRRLIGWLLGAVLLGASPMAWAFDPTLGECTKTFEVGPSEIDSITTTSAKLCSLDCLATGANGWVAAWDTPNSAETNAGVRDAQAKLFVEKGSATAGDSSSTGAIARFTEFGLTIQTFNCRATGSYRD